MNILVIRPGAIGDVLLTFPILQGLREKYSGPHITFVSNASVLPLAQASGLVDEVSDYQDILWSELFSTTGIRTSILTDRLQARDMAICWLRDAEGIVERNLHEMGIRHIIIAPGRPPQEERIHIVEYLANTVEVEDVILRFAQNLSSGRAQILRFAQNDSLWQPTRFKKPTRISTPPSPLQDHSSLLDEYIAIHPGSGGAQKCWPVESFACVIERLWEHSRPVLLLAGPADVERLAYLQRRLVAPPVTDLFSVLFNAPLLEVARQLQQCRGYLGNDSGITHLAAMLGVPTVAIFGTSDPVIWRPVGNRVSVIYEPGLENLPVDVVMEALKPFYVI